MILKRIFQPIGQGAFYCEIHESFNAIYDCGVGRRYPAGKAITRNIQNLQFPCRDTILFISHFDTDHISCINALRNNPNIDIKYVIMPLLQPVFKIFLSALIYNRFPNGLDIIWNPSQFFGKSTKIILVESGEVNENYSDFPENSLDEIANNKTIKSGTPLYYIDNRWVFVPYNHDYSVRNHQLKTALSNVLTQQLNLTIQNFINDPNYAITTIHHHHKIIKQVYHSLRATGGYGSAINENSMFLYSGLYNPQTQSLNPTFKHLFLFVPFHHLQRPMIQIALPQKYGCIYTGDGNLNQVDINIIYKRFMPNVETVQIPHHGSLGNFSILPLSKQEYYCPISCGHQSKRFPSKHVVSSLFLNKCLPICVTERKAFIELF